MKLIGDFWYGNVNKEYVLNDVSFADASQALDEIDGMRKTELLFEKNDTSLIIAGGSKGLFIVNYFVSDEMSYALERETKDEGTITLICGGQAGVFSVANCFAKDVAKKVLQDFFSDIDILDKYRWRAA